MYGINKDQYDELLVSAPECIRDATKGNVLLLSGSILVDQVWLEEWLHKRVDAIYSWGSLNLAANAKVSPFKDNGYDIVLVSCFENDAFCNATPLHMIQCALHSIVDLWPNAVICFMFMPETCPKRRLECVYRHEYHSFMLRACRTNRVVYIDASALDKTLKRYDRRHMDQRELRRFGRILREYWARPRRLPTTLCLDDPNGDMSATFVHDRADDIVVNGKRMPHTDPDALWWSDEDTPLLIKGGAHKTTMMTMPFLLCHLCRHGWVDVTPFVSDGVLTERAKHSLDRRGEYELSWQGTRVTAVDKLKYHHNIVKRKDRLGLNRTAYQIIPRVDTSMYFDRLRKSQRLYDVPVTDMISRPRLDAKRDSCEWLWTLCKDIMSAHNELSAHFDLTWNVDDLDSCVHNVIAFRQTDAGDALDWHLDAEDAIALSIYDAGGIDFRCADGSILEHRTTDRQVVASMAPTNVVYHRSVIEDGTRNVIVIFFKQNIWRPLSLVQTAVEDHARAFSTTRATDAPELDVLSKTDSTRFNRIRRLLTDWFPNESPDQISLNMQQHTVIFLESKGDIVGAEIVQCFHSTSTNAVVLQILYIVTSIGGCGYGSQMHNGVRYIVQAMHSDKNITEVTCADNTRQARQFWKAQGLRATTRARTLAKDLNIKCNDSTPMDYHSHCAT